ncbi:unnamed protein product, partial [Rotaria sp. Silwood2]
MKQFRGRRSNMPIYTSITAFLPFVEVDLNLTPQQMFMFINGYKYIIPCQTRLSSKTVEQHVSEQYQSISTTIKNCLRDHRIPTSDQRAKEAFHSLQHILLELQSKMFSRTLERRAKHENKIMQTTDLARKAKEYMLKTITYQEITNGRCPLSDMLYAVQKLLSSLVTQKAITIQQFKKISPKTMKLELGHYHGLPKPHKPGTPLRPIVASIHAPTTFIDVVRKLEQIVLDGHFQVTTKFIGIDVTDLYTMIPREGALHALIRFLENNPHRGKIGTLSIDAIMRMARLILDTNYFAYDHKYYRQIRT